MMRVAFIQAGLVVAVQYIQREDAIALLEAKVYDDALVLSLGAQVRVGWAVSDNEVVVPPTLRVACLVGGVIENVVVCWQEDLPALKASNSYEDFLVLEREQAAQIGWSIVDGKIIEPPPAAPKTIAEVAVELATAFKSAAGTDASVEALAAALVAEHLKSSGLP